MGAIHTIRYFQISEVRSSNYQFISVLQVIIDGVRGNGYTSDAAIDDITFTFGVCSGEGKNRCTTEEK